MRIAARLLFVGLFAVLAAALGTATALVTVPAGKDLLARLVTEESNRLVRGSVSIQRIRGSFLEGLSLDSVVIRDTAGALLADIPRLEVRFTLADLLARRFIFSSVRAVRPRLEVVKHRDGRMNYQEILRLNEGPPSTGPGTFLVLRNLAVEAGEIVLSLPWNPDGRLRTAAQRDSALAAERAKPGRRIETGFRASDGLMNVRTIAVEAGRFPELRISTPDRLPFAMTIDSLSASVSDPGVRLAGLAGRVTQGADSLLFDLDRVALPGTVLSGGGRIDWPRDTVLYDFAFDAERLDLADLRWISPGFPDFTGRGRVVGKSLAGSRTEYDLRGLTLAGEGARVSGSLIAILDVYRGLGFRNLDVALTDFDLALLDPYLDSLPFQGRISGPLKASGFFDGMVVNADWTYLDTAIDSGAVNRLRFEGEVAMGGGDGLAFHGTRLVGSDFDLRTVRRVAPAVALEGRLALAGTLEGPLRDVTFIGEAAHRDGELPASTVRGRARLDTRAALLGVSADLTLDTLSFDGIRPSFPSATFAGGLSGRVRLDGRTDSMRVDADLAGAIGRYRIVGLTSLTPPAWGARDLAVEFAAADLAALGSGPRTRLAGRARIGGVLDSVAAPVADVSLVLGAGSIREFSFDSARARLRIRDSVVTVDSASARWEGGLATATGTLGWDRTHDGTLEFSAYALNLAPFDSLAAALLDVRRADLTETDLMSGRARTSGSLTGSVDAWRLTGRLQADSAAWRTDRVRVAAATFDVTGGPEGPVRMLVEAEADSIARGRFRFADLTARVEGAPDEFGWRAAVDLGPASRMRGDGYWTAGPDSTGTLRIDSLTAQVLGRTWSLADPVVIAVDTVITADTVSFATPDGTGQIWLTGVLPGRSAGAAEVHALGIGLRDVYAIAQRDTTGVEGIVALDARVGGTLEAPTLRGSATITGPVIGTVRAPLVRSVFDYRDKLLRSNLTFWRTGRPVLEVDGSLPFDLAVADVERRQLPGQLVIRGQADSVDLGVIEALTPNLRGVVGNLAIDARVNGTWDAPRLDGFVSVSDGAAYVPGLRVNYGPFDGRVRLVGDSLVADSIVIHSGDAVAQVGGVVRLEALTRPVLDLTLSATEIPLIDVPGYLTLHGTGDISLTGPLERPVLTGEARATKSVLYFADLLSKDIVNLEDPANADLIDTTALRTQGLGAQFQSRFLDSLTIRDLRFRVGQDVWLRSEEANIQLEGVVTVNKDRRRAGRNPFRVSGQLNTPRGTYTLRLNPVVRSFQVVQGSVQYFNTPDLNAGLDLTARYVVRTVTATSTDDYPIIARITGTLLVPEVRLESEPGRQQLPERDLVSLLVFGTTSSSVLGGGATVSGASGLSLAAGYLTSELERLAVSSPNSPVDLFEIRPGFIEGNSAFSTGGTVTALSVGRQLSNRLFAILNLGGCLNQGAANVFNQQYLGATLEYRLHPTMKLQIAAEPVQSCLSQVGNTLVRPSRYQFGADLKWDREY